MLAILGIVAFALTIIIHEVAHGWVADKLGDPTARLSGRLTLNPIPHIDLYGTILLPLFLIVVHSPFVFGWAKPVPIDPYNLKDQRKDPALISLAGPLANIIIATVLAIVFRFTSNLALSELIKEVVALNVALAIFNLIPISPLDGEKVLVGILPKKEAYQYDSFMSRYGMLLLLFVIFPVFNGISLLNYFVYPVMSFVINLLLPGVGTI